MIYHLLLLLYTEILSRQKLHSQIRQLQLSFSGHGQLQGSTAQGTHSKMVEDTN